jgi:hypothetical protein
VMGGESFAAALTAGRAMSRQEVTRVAFGEHEMGRAMRAMNGHEEATGDDVPKSATS